MAAHSTDISVSARLSELTRLTRLLADEAQRLGVAKADSQRLQLIAEELFVNTLQHGFQGDNDSIVSLALSTTPEGIRLRYTDSAPPHDPTVLPAKTASAETAGGLGITLIRGMSRTFHYWRQDGRNICEVLL